MKRERERERKREREFIRINTLALSVKKMGFICFVYFIWICMLDLFESYGHHGVSLVPSPASREPFLGAIEFDLCLVHVAPRP